MKNKSKTVLITGAANGIGLAISEYLIQKGFIIIAADYDEDALRKFDEKKNVITVFLDVTKNETIENAVEELSGRIDGLDGLVNNAGIFIGGSLLEIDIEELKHLIDINVLGYVRVTKAFFPLLRAKKGKVINIGSEVGRISFPFNGPYSISKYAIECFSDTLRRELMFLGMKVVLIQPGAMKTQFTDKTIDVYKKFLGEDYIFSDQINRLWPILEKERYSNPIHVAQKVYRILKKERPKHRYRVKNNKQRRILEFLPSSWSDFLIKYLM